MNKQQLLARLHQIQSDNTHKATSVTTYNNSYLITFSVIDSCLPTQNFFFNDNGHTPDTTAQAMIDLILEAIDRPYVPHLTKDDYQERARKQYAAHYDIPTRRALREIFTDIDFDEQ